MIDNQLSKPYRPYHTHDKVELLIPEKVYEVEHYSNCIIFENIDSKFMATRYHSLAGSEQLPECLEITARTIKDKEIMGVKHIEYKIYGLQFHPDSIETVHGLKMIENFINGI